MNQPSRLLAAAVAAFALVACSGGGGGSSGGGGGGGGSPLTATASSSSIRADGVATVTIHVDGGEAGSVSVSTSRGWFDGQVTSLTMPATPFDVVLYTCDSRLDRSCAGVATVSVLDKALARRSVSIQLKQLEICNNNVDDNGDGKVDCADADCPESTSCSAFGKTCGADAKCSVCSGNGGSPQLAEASCDDGFDNDCDGKLDCDDSECSGKICRGATTTDGKGLTTGTCNTTSKTCVCTPKAEVCNDTVDNDCDGKIDCDDPDCQPVGNGLGKVCDAVGHSCSPPALTGGTSVCGVVCSGNGGTPQPPGTETNCFDGFDNDCNGLADCQDPNCAGGGLACSSTGKTCGTDYQCLCRKPEASTGEGTCDDGADNDCDGLIDCKDPDCQKVTASCGAKGYGFTCNSTAGGTCACSGNGGLAEKPEASCADGADNDCDGAADCLDTDCRPTTAGAFGKGCGSTTQAFFGYACDFLGRCVCSKGQTTEVSCGDGQDNDCDGLVDCADPDCQPLASNVLGQACASTGLTCGVDGACSICSGNGGTPAANEADGTSCADGFDNDCDGKIDCDDSQCAGKQCYAGSPSYQCRLVKTAYTCMNNSSDFGLKVTASSTRIAANGIATATITAKLTRLDGTGTPQPQANGLLTFAVSGYGTLSATSFTTDGNGVATITFYSSPLGGPAEITATYDNAGTPIVGSITIDQPSVAQVKLVSTQYKVMGAKWSAFQETNVLKFQIIDSMNVPYPAGLQVDFSHQAIGGSYIGAVESCVEGPPRVCSASGITDAQGNVTVMLHSGTIASPVTVTATATGGGTTADGVASQLAVVGAKASGMHISVQCTPVNVPGFTIHDCINSKYGGTDNQINCRVALADRFNNVLGVATLATFESEAGAAGPPATTPAYDPTRGPDQQTTLGRATDYVAVTGYGLPVDVAPRADEYGYQYDDGFGCGTRLHNPRDGLSTVIVRANGEEGFVDGSNGFPRNGKYDVGEDFIDIGEPFVDANDNGHWDPEDPPFNDVNGNGVWDGPNGKWDENTVIWAETRVMYSGYPMKLTTGGTEYGSRFYRPPAVMPSPTPTARFLIRWADKANGVAEVIDALSVFFTDQNYNPPTYRENIFLSWFGNVRGAWAGPLVADDLLGIGMSQLYCSKPDPTPDEIPLLCDSAVCRSAPCYVVTNVGSYAYGRTIGVAQCLLPTMPYEDRNAAIHTTATFNGVGVTITAPGECLPPIIPAP